VCFGRLAVLAEVIWKMTALKRWMTTEIAYVEIEMKSSWVISDSRDSMTQMADELRFNDIDGAHCLECKRIEQVSLRYFSIFDFFALCCGFGGAGWSNCHVLMERPWLWLCWWQWRPKWRCVLHATGLMSIHPVASRLTWSTLVVPWRMECQPWLMNAKSSHLCSDDCFSRIVPARKIMGSTSVNTGTAGALV